MTCANLAGRIIDVHNHPDWLGHDLNRFIANLDSLGIAKSWLFSWEAPASEYDPHYDSITSGAPLAAPDGYGPIPFARCLYYKERAPERFVLGYAPDPRRPDGLDRLKAAVSIYGVQVCGEIKLRMMYDNLDAIAMWRWCGENGLPVTVHIDDIFDRGTRYPRPNYWYGGGIAAFERAVAACPDTRFLGHAPGFWAHVSGDYNPADGQPYPKGPVTPGGKVPEMLRKYPNLYCDISAGSGATALRRDPEFGRSFILEFQDRILYARDNFDNQHQELLDAMNLPDEVMFKVLFENAEKILGG